MVTKSEDEIYVRDPIKFHGRIPVFSRSNEYIENYRVISEDHLKSFYQNGTNPFFPEDLWVEFEQSTAALIRKYSKPGDRVLDVGVGMGRLMHQFPRLRRHGMDISYGYLEIAQKKGIDVCYALAEDMPYRERLFDLVICTDVLEHVLDLNLCCTKILSVLKKGGILIVRTPFKENLKQYLEETNPYKYIHLRSFDEFFLRLLFERVLGCEILEITTVGYIVDSSKVKYPMPFMKLNVLLSRLVTVVKRLHAPGYAYLIEKLYDPLGINVVTRRLI